MTIVINDEVFQDFELACAAAKGKSHDGCGYHVNVQVSMMRVSREIHIMFIVSDWYSSGQTVASFSDGREV